MQKTLLTTREFFVILSRRVRGIFVRFTSRNALKREIAGQDPVTSVEYVRCRWNSRHVIGRLKFSDTGGIAYIACTENEPA